MIEYNTCPACQTENRAKEKYCLNCGQKLIEETEKEIILKDKLPIPKDKIILLDLNYTLISNSWKIRFDKLTQKIYNRQYEHEMVNKIKDNYVILITASPYYTSFGIGSLSFKIISFSFSSISFWPQFRQYFSSTLFSVWHAGHVL